MPGTISRSRARIRRRACSTTPLRRTRPWTPARSRSRRTSSIETRVLTEPRPTTMSEIPQAAASTAVDRIVERLSSIGYRIDSAKWRRLVDAGIVDEPRASEGAEREALGRLRRILDVEHRLGPSHDLDALSYFAAAAGIDDIPSAAVTRHIVHCVDALFRIGDGIRHRMTGEIRFVGPDEQWRVARQFAKTV